MSLEDRELDDKLDVLDYLFERDKRLEEIQDRLIEDDRRLNKRHKQLDEDQQLLDKYQRIPDEKKQRLREKWQRLAEENARLYDSAWAANADRVQIGLELHRHAREFGQIVVNRELQEFRNTTLATFDIRVHAVGALIEDACGHVAHLGGYVDAVSGTDLGFAMPDICRTAAHKLALCIFLGALAFFHQRLA